MLEPPAITEKTLDRIEAWKPSTGCNVHDRAKYGAGILFRGGNLDDFGYRWYEKAYTHMLMYHAHYGLYWPSADWTCDYFGGPWYHANATRPDSTGRSDKLPT